MKKNDNRKRNNSMLLSRDENEQIFSLLGQKCQALATAVIQLFCTDSPDGEEWIKKDAGVLCLVRDAKMRSYFLRLYCLSRNEMIWEHEIYKDMEYLAPQPFFHTFEAEEHIVAFNFASDHEARYLRKVLLEKQEKRGQKKLKTRNESDFTNGNEPVEQPPTESTSILNYFGLKLFSLATTNSSKKTKVKGLTKHDIGIPENAVHVSGYNTMMKNIKDEPNGYVFEEIISASKNELTNRRTSWFVPDSNSPSLPPSLSPQILHLSSLSSRNGNSSHSDLPPSPSTGNYEQQVKSTSSIPPPPFLPSLFDATTGKNHAIIKDTSEKARSATSYQTILINSVPPPPPPPPPQCVPPSLPYLSYNDNCSSNGVPLPPPPPPLAFSTSSEARSPNIITDPRSELMDAIKNGTKLKPVNLDSEKMNDNPRNELLRQIEQGIILKPVPSTAKSAQPNNKPAGTLEDVLKKRLEALRIDSDESSDNDETDSDEWD